MRDDRRESDAADLDAIVKDITSLKKDIGKLMEHVKVGAAETVNGKARHIYDSLAAEGERSAAAIAQQVEERPFSSLLVAFAVGFIGSRLLTR
jgi:ElaB/YqjD/DUF883 family membrane-anchored ribosome-binding protein